jgi:RNA polymerase sigma factor, sigma-70 family
MINSEDELFKIMNSEKQIVLLIGSGVSKSISNNKYANWRDWIEAGLLYADNKTSIIVKELLFKNSSKDLIKAAGVLKRHLHQNGSYETWMQKTIGSLQMQFIKMPSIIRKFMQYGSVIITTNYDLLLEEYIGCKAVTYSETDIIFRMLEEKNINAIIHIHGYYDKEHKHDDTIAGEDDYNKILDNEKVQFLQRLIAIKSIICIGCGATIDDPNIGPLLTWLTNLGGIQSHFYLAKEGSCPELPNCVRPVFYGDSFTDMPEYVANLLKLREKAITNKFSFISKNFSDLEYCTNDGIYRLSYHVQWIPFAGREKETDRMISYCNEDKEIVCFSIIGAGGMGKSRIALELMKKLPATWFSFFLERNYNEQDVAKFKAFTDTIVMIDYIVGREKIITNFMQEIIKQFRGTIYKLRFVLIEREKEDWFHTNINTSEDLYWKILLTSAGLSSNNMNLIILDDLDESPSKIIIKNVFEKSYYKYCQKDINYVYSLFSKSFKEHFKRPLLLQIFTVAWMEGHKNWKQGKELQEIFDWITIREENRWEMILSKILGDNIKSQIVEEELYNWKDILCYSIILRGVSINSNKLTTFNEIWHVLEEKVGGKRVDKTFKDKVEIFISEMTGFKLCYEIKLDWPDIISEYIFIKYIDRREEKLNNFFIEVWEEDQKTVTETLSRIIEDFPNDNITIPINKFLFDKLSINYKQRYLIENNIYLVEKMSKQFFRQYNIKYDELFSAASFGLLNTSNYKYDLAPKEFKKYAFMNIRKEMMKLLDNPNQNEIVFDFNDDYDELNFIIDSTFDQTSMEELFIQKEDRANLYKALNTCLIPIERQIIILKYGFGYKPYTISEISKIVGLTNKEIKKIENDALGKLYNSMGSA